MDRLAFIGLSVGLKDGFLVLGIDGLCIDPTLDRLWRESIA